MSFEELHFYEGKHELEGGQLCPPKNRKEERRQTMEKIEKYKLQLNTKSNILF